MKTLKNEWIYFWTSLMFFTRIPFPFKLPYSDEIMNKSKKYYAWVGLIVGLFNDIIYTTSSYLFSDTIGLILMMCSSVLLTGAFHEDGFTDVCDSFGGGYGKEKIMTIMKDSRIVAKSLPYKDLLIGIIGFLVPLLLYPELKFLALIPIAYLSKIYLCWYFKKHIGGYTGDCLGTIQQVSEVVIYLGAIIIWKFI